MSPRNQGSGQPRVLPDGQAAASPSKWGGSGRYLFVTGGEPSIDPPHLRETTPLQFMYTGIPCFYRRENGITVVFMFVRFLGFIEKLSSCSGLMAHNHVPKYCTSYRESFDQSRFPPTSHPRKAPGWSLVRASTCTKLRANLLADQVTKHSQGPENQKGYNPGIRWSIRPHTLQSPLRKRFREAGHEGRQTTEKKSPLNWFLEDQRGQHESSDPTILL